MELSKRTYNIVLYFRLGSLPLGALTLGILKVILRKLQL